MDITECLVIAAVAYLMGSIPTGYLVGMARGIDVRKAGSGNIGATNVFRVLGTVAGIFVLVVDGLKGWAAVDKIPELVHHYFHHGTAWDEESGVYLRIIAGISVILGHNYTCWLRFKGGKGIATTAGVLAALMMMTFIVSLSTWIVVCLVTRYVSLASIVAALAMPLATWLSGKRPLMIVISALLAVLAIYKHKANIGRLLNGTENRLGRKAGPPATGAAS